MRYLFPLTLALLLTSAPAAFAADIKSHPPLRQNPKPKGPFHVASLTLDTARVVHPTEGDDTKAGTLA